MVLLRLRFVLEQSHLPIFKQRTPTTDQRGFDALLDDVIGKKEVDAAFWLIKAE